MKTITALTIAGALALGLGAFSANAGEVTPQGRSGYRVTHDRQDRETTVALYTGERTTQAVSESRADAETHHVIQAQGRAGYRHSIE